MARTLAVIDDDQEIRSLLTEYLELNGFNVQTYENGTSFLQQGLTGCDLADRIAVMKDGEVQQLGTPNQIYDDPANQFVAGFMGSPPMNFIPCESDDDCLRVNTGGRSYLFRMKDGQVLKKSGLKRAVMGIRHEMVTEPKPSPGGEWTHQLEMDFEVTEPMGADTIAIGQWNGAELLARLSPEAGLAAGAGTVIQVDVSKVVLFHPETGERLR